MRREPRGTPDLREVIGTTARNRAAQGHPALTERDVNTITSEAQIARRTLPYGQLINFMADRIRTAEELRRAS